MQRQYEGGPLKHILLVEDSRFLRVFIAKALAKAGYAVATACDGEEALRMAFARIPDLILLDMLLPKLGGVQVLQSLRKTPLTAGIPVIVLSSLAQKNGAKVVKDGATAYFEKSKLELDRNSETLIAIVNKTLDDRMSLGHGEKPVEHSIAAAASVAAS
jgi:twitching motility two-component system response regulator PilH